MKRLFTLFAFFVLAISLTKASPVDIATARQVGYKFMRNSHQMRLSSSDVLRHADTYYTDRGAAAFYVFNMQKGFVIIAADDCARPVLGYSTEGPFNRSELPVQMEGYLQDLSREIGYGIEKQLRGDSQISNMWQSVMADGVLSSGRTHRNAVAPLLAETWDQNCYYNAMCPADENGPCGHVYAGCVATAMGQIMHYWKYPANGQGSHSYYPDGYDEQSADFGATTYNWDLMPNELTGSSSQEEIDAVATLLWHCGISVNMMYGAGGSGAYSSDVPGVLINNFLYDAQLYGHYRSDNAAWIEEVKSTLDQGRPVYYTGQDTNGQGGHAFVCDGYDADDLLHFNWGWSGSANNYFVVDALNVGGYQFNNSNYGIFNIVPPCDSDDQFLVTAVASSPSMGSVSGSGSYGCDEECVLTATAKPQYTFLYWKEGSKIVSRDTEISFVVREDRSLEAVFAASDQLCNLIVNMYDSYGDGWNGNQLVVTFADGATQQLTLDGGSSGSMSCPFLDGGEVQLSWIMGSWTEECSYDITFENGVILYHGENMYTGFSHSFVLNCSDATGTHTITATAYPVEGGVVTGGGDYEAGAYCSLEAVPNDGWLFTYWTENDEVVSYNQSMYFMVAADRHLVANFLNVCTLDPENLQVQVNTQDYSEATVSWTSDNSLFELRYKVVNTEGFENGIPEGWTTIDADGDGYTWIDMNNIGQYTTYYNSMTLNWCHGGSNAMISGSYINGIGVLTPDNYLVSPRMPLGDNASMSFWAGAADPNYPADHFGVFVSTTGTNPEDFVMVQEWTLTAKSKGSVPSRASRDSKGMRMATWYNYTVDLSDYAGQQVYVAFRHFDCTDQYIISIDDVEFNLNDSEWTVITDITDTSYTLTGLDDKSDYIVQVRSSCGDGEHYSNWVETNFTTEQYTVTVTADPIDVATVSGSGVFPKGAICYLGTEVYQAGYHLAYWTMNGEIVSYDSYFSFTVTEDADLVAVYEPYDMLEGQMDYSSYDWQSNSGARTWTHVWPNGDVNFAYTVAKNKDYTDRGTGIGMYHAATGEWTAVGGRVENEKTGFGSIAQYGSNGLVIASHTPNDCRVYIVEDKDQIEPNSLEAVSVLDNTYDLAWPAVMTSGPNRDIIHIIVTATVNNIEGMESVTDPLVYFRSTDGGQTWDKENVILPFMGPEYAIDWTSNCCHWMETTDDNCLALVVNNAWSDGMVIYSYDDGETWERKVFYQHPDPFTYQNQFFYPRWVSCQWDSNHKLHLLYEFNGSEGDPGSGSYYPNEGGVAYWNEDMEVMDMYSINELRNSTWYNGNFIPMPMEYVGYLPPLSDEGDPESPYDNTGFNIYDYRAHGSYNQGVCGFPVLCMVPGSDDMVAVWAAMDENHTDSNGNHYYKIFARYSANAGQAWSPMVQLTKDASCEWREHVYLQAAVVGRTLLVAAQTDGVAGTFVQSDDNDFTDNLYRGFSFNIDETFVTRPMERCTVTAVANPVEGGMAYGGGEYYEGAFITLQAEANPNYEFLNWTCSGEVISYEPYPIVMVTSSGEYVANYELKSCIVNPKNLRASAAGSDQVRLNWSAPGNLFDLRYKKLFYEEFEIGTLGSWTTIDADGDGYTWENQASNGTVAHSGQGVAASASYINNLGALTPDNWLVSPLLELGGVFSFWAAGQDPSYVSEHFAVYVSTGDAVVSDFVQVMDESVVTSTMTKYTVDLSGYAGETGYIAIRHFNCADMFRLNIDDIYYQEPGEEAWTTFTGITDKYFMLTDLEENAYYRVEVRSSCGEDEQYSDWVDCSFLNTIYYINTTSDPIEGGSIDGAGYYLYGSTCTIVARPNNGYSLMYWTENEQEVSNEAIYSFEVSRDRDLVAHFSQPFMVTLEVMPEDSGEVSGAGEYYYGATCTLIAYPSDGFAFLSWTKDGVVVGNSPYYTFIVTEDAHYVANFVMQCAVDPENLQVFNVGHDDIVISWTSPLELFDLRYAKVSYYSFEDGTLGEWTAIDADGDGYTWENQASDGTVAHSGQGVAASASYINYQGALTPDNWLVSPLLELGGVFSFWAAGQDPSYVSEHFAVYVSTGDAVVSDFVQVMDESVVTSTMTKYTVDLSGYAGETGYVAIRHFNCTDMFRLNIDDIYYQEPGEVEWTTFTGITDNLFTLTGLEENEHYMVEVRSNCGDGEHYGNWVSTDFDYVMCNITAVSNPNEGGMVYGTGYYLLGLTCTLLEVPNDGFTFVNWTKDGIVIGTNSTYSFKVSGDAEYVANYLPTCTLEPSNLVLTGYGSSALHASWYSENGMFDLRYAKVSYYSFEDGTLGEWTAIDADGDGYTWENQASDGTVAHSGQGVAASASYINYQGALTPDNWLVSPLLELGGVFSFWAAGQDPSYVSEHFAVYVSTGDAVVSDFVQVMDESVVTSTMTKYTVDLSGYAGETGYIAIRHFNCTDMFRLNIDDIMYQDPSLGTWTTIPDIGDNSYLIYNLDTGSNYYVEVRSNCGDGNSSNWIGAITTSRTLTAFADPEESGTIVGAGTFFSGSSCTLTAIPSEGFLFQHWTEDGTIVNASSTYSLNLYDDTEYVAHFEQPEGTYVGDHSANIDNRYLPSYSYYNYSLTQQIYTSDEIGRAGEISAISFFNAGGTKTRNLSVYLVHTDKSNFINNSDWIAVTEEDRVFSGEVTMTMGYWTKITFDVPFAYDGSSNLALMVDDNTGSYLGAPHLSCRVYNTESCQAIRMFNDNLNYDPSNTSSYNGTMLSVKNQLLLQFASASEIDQTLDLSSGWTWMSVYPEASDELFEALKDGIAETNITAMIKAQDGSIMLQNGSWSVGDFTLDNEHMLMTNLATPATVTLTAAPADPAAHPITIVGGWNWIGFISSEEMTVSEALAGIAPTPGDMIKSAGDGASSYTANGWEGSLSSLEPGKGYMYNNKGANLTLVYPASAKGVVRSLPVEKYWSTNVHEHATNLVMMATLDESQFAMGEGNYEIGAFVNGECRGSARLQKTSYGYVAFVVVHGDYDETIRFQLYDVTNAMVVGSSEEQLRYVSNAIVGSVEEPMVLHFRGITDVNEEGNSLSVFPNPTKDNVKIQGQAIETVSVYNALGQCLINETYGNATDLELNLSGLSAGVYTVAIRANGTVITKLVVKE